MYCMFCYSSEIESSAFAYLEGLDTIFVSRGLFSGNSKIKMALKIDEEWIRERVHLQHDNLGKILKDVAFFSYVLCIHFSFHITSAAVRKVKICVIKYLVF